MSNERDILCGGASPRRRQGTDSLHLWLWGNGKNIFLTIEDIEKRLTANVPDVLTDLLEIAAYVYTADQAVTRGGNGVLDHGANWRRELRFLIPVRKPDLWKSPPVKRSLTETLGFLSEDDYTFTFTKLRDPRPMSHYLEFGPGGATGFDAEEVVLFSGGLDSLAGATDEILAGALELVSGCACSEGCPSCVGPLAEVTGFNPKEAVVEFLSEWRGAGRSGRGPRASAGGDA